MSHFLTFVLVSQAEKDVAGKVRELMYPYFEGYKVAPYKEYLDEVDTESGIEWAVEKHGFSLDDREKIADVLSARWKEEILVDGTGMYVWSTRNPNTKCDGFVIGGCYDQEIFGVEPMYNLTPAEYQKRYGLDVIRDENNIRPASEVPTSLVPYAIVIPNGKWFDCEQKESEVWRREVAALLHEYRENLVTAVDCHC